MMNTADKSLCPAMPGSHDFLFPLGWRSIC
jgi:hypothetical protein